ncbi:hypothetical protein [Limnochorda pilosa]|uniref:Uncharacterized protein n=1 Tax=Limnochorda pilosa TaxID=1555112 RepID=A0A0K2SGR8_LIMPI|nr:hypothetical protein [Limnochorda pilosa]BAS26034.1 hypothetical protein LIP_0177 [Limnochorda pilosa]
MQRNICPFCQRASYTSEGMGRVTSCPYCGAHFLTGFDTPSGRPAPKEPVEARKDSEGAREGL